MDKRILAMLILLTISWCLVTSAEKPAICSEPHAVGTGPCDMLLTAFYFEAQQNSCQQFTESGCQLGEGQKHDTEDDCRKTCVDVA